MIKRDAAGRGCFVRNPADSNPPRHSLTELKGRSHFLTFIFGQRIVIHLCQYLSSCHRLADTIHGNFKLG